MATKLLLMNLKNSSCEPKVVFAWTYKEMPGLDPKVAIYYVAIKQEARLIKQSQGRFWPELRLLSEIEVNKLIKPRFH